MSKTGCQCPLAGYCPRHKIEKPGRLHELCQSDPRYFDHWELMTHTPEPARRAAARARRLGEFHRLWRELHTYHWTSEAEARSWFERWQKQIPRFGCKCRRHWAKIVAEFPPNFSSPDAFFAWGVAAHNLVNEQLGKPKLSLEEAKAIWGKEGGRQPHSCVTPE